MRRVMTTVCGLLMTLSSVAAAAQPEDIFEPFDWAHRDPVRLASGAPGPAYWQNEASYRIAVELDPDTRRVSGTLACEYVNNSPHELGFVWLNLEQNAFTPGSIGNRALAPGMWWRVPKDFEGGFDLGDAAVDGELVEVAVYDTLGRVTLPEPLTPGESVTLELDFAMTIPPRGRLGVYEADAGEVFQLAHWFPNIAKYDDISGWNVLPHEGDGEFYTDFGDYTIEITVPADHIVACTGELVNQDEVLTAAQRERLAKAYTTTEAVVVRGFDEIPDEPATETRTWRFEASDVRSVAWASSRSFRWDAAIAAEGRPVLCQAFYPEEGAARGDDPRWEAAVEYGRHAINYYSDWLLEYPYPTATNVGGVVGGMEYPMIVFCSIDRDPKSLFGVTDHEFGHEWFPMIVNSDERRHAWMDEGINTFINHYSFTDYWGEARRIGSPQFIVDREMESEPQPIMTYPDRVQSGSLGYLAYSKPGYAVRVLREYVLGEERFDEAFREYVRRWMFKSPQPEDFFQTIEDAAGADLTWFWRGWFYEAARLDQGIYDIDPEPRRGEIGLTLANFERMVMPVVMDVTYDDGTSERRRVPVQAWTNGATFPVYWPAEGRSIVKVVLDPEGLLPDIDPADNVWEADDGEADMDEAGLGDADPAEADDEQPAF
ncbi:MAG: M1 family metallopeptidase [Planctomycetota bacterium]